MQQNNEIQTLTAFAKTLATAAAEAILPHFRQPLQVDNKLGKGWDPVTEGDKSAERAIRALIEKHLDYTKSPRAKEVLANWEQMVPKFVKILPKDYKRMLACIERAQSQGLTGDEAIMAAFEENARDTSRVGGN